MFPQALRERLVPQDLSRGAATSGDMTGLDGKYDKEDIVNFGDFVPVPCPRGAVRITMPAIAHGSTANDRGTKR